MIEKIRKINVVALVSALYFSLVWITYFYLSMSVDKKLNAFIFLLILGLSYPIIKAIVKKLQEVKICNLSNITLKGKILVFSISAVFVFIVLLLWFFAYYPGSFSPDSIGQYSQVITGEYGDWHPVWHTFLFFTIPITLFKNPAAIVIIQIIYFSLIIGYLALVVFEMSNIKVTITTILFIMLNPYTGYILLYPWKDVAFSMGGLLSGVIVIKLLSKKESIKIVEIILFSIVLISTTLFRHNAILYTLPLLLVFIISLNDKKKSLYLVCCSVVFLLIIKVAFYGYLGVEKPGQRVIESTGLPLTVIGNVAKETPELMDEELSDFVYTIATPEQWQESYYCGNFNSIKWAGAKLDIVEEKGFFGMIHLMNKCFVLSPHASFEALFALTDMVYGFEAGLEGNVGAGITENDYGIAYPEVPNPIFQNIQHSIVAWNDFVNCTIFKYFRTYGVCLFALILVYLSKLTIKDISSIKKTFMVIPLLAYDFGTMILLTGPDSRFFFITFLLTPLLIVYSFHKGEV